MKSAVFPKKNELIYTNTEKPTCTPGHAIVRVKYAGICGSDVNVWQGKHATATYPRIPGHELVGTLEEYDGKTKMQLSKGDKVVVQPFDSCGICNPCVTGKSNVCKELAVLGIHQDGGFAEYVKVPLNKVYALPQSVDDQVAALTEPLAVAMHDVRRSGLEIGQSALIIGGGPIGILIAMMARETGASKVLISEISSNRLAFAKSLGFETIDPAKENVGDRVRKQTGGRGVDVVFEVSGSSHGVATMTDAVKTGGTVMLIGMSSENNPIDTSAVFFKELTLRGARLHSEDVFEDAVELVACGRLNQDLRRLISAVFPLSQIVEAMHHQIEDTEHFKIIIDTTK